MMRRDSAWGPMLLVFVAFLVSAAAVPLTCAKWRIYKRELQDMGVVP